MRRDHVSTVGLVFLFVLVLSISSRAHGTDLTQTPAPPPSPADERDRDSYRRVGFEVDLRVGAAALDEPDADVKASVGGRVAVYPFNGTIARRIGFHVHGDYAELSRIEGFLPGLPGATRTTRHWFTVAPLVGFDLVLTPRFILDVRGGGAFDGTLTRFELEGDDSEDDESPDDFVDVCDLRAFEQYCHSRTRFTAVVAVGARFFPASNGHWSLGADFSANGVGRRQIVGTVGISIPPRGRPLP